MAKQFHPALLDVVSYRYTFSDEKYDGKKMVKAVPVFASALDSSSSTSWDSSLRVIYLAPGREVKPHPVRLKSDAERRAEIEAREETT
jgi:hypothetical protein